MIKLIALDLDGTLLNEEKVIPEATKMRLLKMKKDGIKIVLATGRTFESAKRYYYELDLQTPFIGCNGGLIYMPKKEQVVFSKVFLKRDFRKVISLLAERKIYYQYYGLDCIYAKELAHGVRRWKCENQDLPQSWRMKIELVEDPIKWSTESYQPIYKVLARFESEQEMVQVKASVDAIEGIDAVSSFANALDIGPASCTKGDALERVGDLLGIGLDEMMALGDHDNDREMLAKAGVGIAVGDATEAVKEVADIIMELDNVRGVLQALERNFSDLKI